MLLSNLPLPETKESDEAGLEIFVEANDKGGGDLRFLGFGLTLGFTSDEEAAVASEGNEEE